MLQRDFDRMIKTLAGPILEPRGFTAEGGRGCTFRRQVADMLYHFVQFELLRQTTFEVWVFPATPLLGAEQWQGFPDFVGVPTGRAAGLNAQLGVGKGASRFPCRDKAALVAGFTSAVGPALESHVEPYLASFNQVSDLLPHLEHPQWAALLSEA